MQDPFDGQDNFDLTRRHEPLKNSSTHNHIDLFRAGKLSWPSNVANLEHPNTMKSLSNSNRRMAQGRCTRFLQWLIFNKERLVKCSIDEGRSTIAVPFTWSSRNRSMFFAKSGIFLTLEQPERVKISRDSISSLLGRLTRLVQSFKFKKIRRLSTPTDGWTSIKFVQPSKSILSSSCASEKSGVLIRFREWLSLMNLKLSNCCSKKRISFGMITH